MDVDLVLMLEDGWLAEQSANSRGVEVFSLECSSWILLIIHSLFPLLVSSHVLAIKYSSLPVAHEYSSLIITH